MDKLPRILGVFAVIAALIAVTSVVGAGERDRGNAHQDHRGDPAIASEVASEPRDLVGSGAYGVGVTPAVYLINFLLMYIASPNDAANMPAYRTPIPLPLSECLDLSPGGCSYFEFARFFDEALFRARAKRDKSCSLPPVCQTNPRWARLAPPVATKPDQINEPLGMERAGEIARSLNIQKDMILTDREFQCTIGTAEDRSDYQKTILACLNNLSNSKGTTNIPLSSYGLAITDPETNPNAPLGARAGNVQSLCAPYAPCLEFNFLFAGPLEEIAIMCGWEQKLDRMLLRTPFFRILEDAQPCQESAGSLEGGACTVEPVCSSGRAGR
jgi:hypothetical protein